MVSSGLVVGEENDLHRDLKCLFDGIFPDFLSCSDISISAPRVLQVAPAIELEANWSSLKPEFTTSVRPIQVQVYLTVYPVRGRWIS